MLELLDSDELLEFMEDNNEEESAELDDRSLLEFDKAEDELASEDEAALLDCFPPESALDEDKRLLQEDKYDRILEDKAEFDLSRDERLAELC